MVTTKEGFASAIQAVFTCPEAELESKVLDIYNKDSVITVNEKRMTWDEFIPYFRGINNSMATVQIKSHQLLRDGNLFAEKHTAYGTGKYGTKTQGEAICMYEVNEDKKVVWLEEVMHLSAGTDPTTLNYK
jgi:hypothetical protein